MQFQLLITVVLTITVAAAFSTTDGVEIPSLSPTSTVTGKAFNRFVVIWLENTDYGDALGDVSLKSLTKQGISLTNHFGVTHPSMPNYVAAVGGDYFGINLNTYTEVPSNVSTVVDLLEEKGISWGSYQEGLPYTGFTGYGFNNPSNNANMYQRKHNPLVIFNSVAQRKERLGRIKNTTLFWDDVEKQRLPQWIFITPNMTSSGHDTSITHAGKWTTTFLEPLMKNEYFIKDTLVLVTFDENRSLGKQNRVLGILLGGAVPEEMYGTTDANYYDHYSEIATVSANWNLSTLGRYDTRANVFELVANKTGDVVRTHPNLDAVYLNASYPGILHSELWAPQPAPNTALVANGRSVLAGVYAEGKTTYTMDLNLPDRYHIPEYFTINITGTTTTTSNTPIHSTSASKASAAESRYACANISKLVFLTLFFSVWNFRFR